MNDIISLSDIEFCFQNTESKKHQFSGLNLNIQKNQKIAIMGINGSGKTTLLKILNGLIFPQKGIYTFNNQVITSKSLKDREIHKNFRKNCVMLFQNADLMLFHSTVYDDLAFGLRQLLQPEKEIAEKIQKWSELFQINNLLKENPICLSGGQKKRIALASIFILEPELVLLDEPFNGLDPIYIHFLIQFLHKIESTLLFTSHSFEISDTIAQKILVLHPKFNKLFFGNTKDFYKDSQIVQQSELITQLSI